MDSLTPLLILAAQQAVKEADENKASSLSVGSALVAACAPVLPSLTAVATSFGLLPLISGLSKTKPAEQRAKSSKGKSVESDGQRAAIDNRVVEAVVERIKSELPTLLETLNATPSRAIVSETYDTVYRFQIAAAQEFLNENRSADLSRVKCLLHKLLPKDYFEYIEQLREHQDPQTIINIMGGQNIVAPNAQSAVQSFHGEKGPKKGCQDPSQRI